MLVYTCSSIIRWKGSQLKSFHKWYLAISKCFITLICLLTPIFSFLYENWKLFRFFFNHGEKMRKGQNCSLIVLLDHWRKELADAWGLSKERGELTFSQPFLSLHGESHLATQWQESSSSRSVKRRTPWDSARHRNIETRSEGLTEALRTSIQNVPQYAPSLPSSSEQKASWLRLCQKENLCLQFLVQEIPKNLETAKSMSQRVSLPPFP